MSARPDPRDGGAGDGPAAAAPIEVVRDGSRPDPDPSGSRLAMALFLASLGMLFAAGVVAHLVIRLRQPEWPPPGSPPLPGGLWLASAALVVLSAVLVSAERAAAAGEARRLRARIAAALALAIGFLLLQAWNWSVLGVAVAAAGQDMFTFTYWSLTVLHALHAVGGVVPLALTALRAGGGRYRPGALQPVHNVAWYWHFLAVTWFAILAVLLV